MDEESSVNAAPVTRLRRRLSVEPEDSPLPTTPSKKRSTRLAAKPQLELIDEVASENAPKRTTRKTAGKEVESEVAGTPTPVTPSRRNTRLRSNTSLLSETITNVESPRAKRALRRNSQLGSDNESSAPITPARQTRRTRKDSTTSVDKQGGAPDESIGVFMVTSTTPDVTRKDTKVNKSETVSPSTRKSLRINKKGENSDEIDTVNIETPVKSKKTTRDDKTPLVSPSHIKSNKTNDTISPKETETESDLLSTSSVNLINEIKTNRKCTTSLSKSTSAAEKIADDLISKKTRTKSWTTLTTPHSNIALTGSNEDMKEQRNSISGSGDKSLNNGSSVSKFDKPGSETQNKLINKTRTSLLLNTSTDNKENLVGSPKLIEIKKSDTVKLFENSPINQKAMVLIEDSDSGSNDKLIIDVQMDGDQCVPVANNANDSRKIREQSAEPMDIDESMPANVTIDDFSDKSNTSKEDIEIREKRKSSISEKSLLNDKSMNKSKRKSSLSQQTSDALTRFSISEEDKSKSAVTSKLDTPSRKSADGNQSKNISVTVEEHVETMNSSFNNSKRKSYVSQANVEIIQNESIKLTNKSQRKSSVSIATENIENINESSGNGSKNVSNLENKFEINKNPNESKKLLNKSNRKSSASTIKDKIEKSINKSKQNASLSESKTEIDENVTEISKSLVKSRKSSTSIVDENLDKLYEISNKSLLNVSNSEITETLNETNKSTNKSQRKSSLSISENIENLNDSNKSKRKSSISQSNQESFINENNDSKNINKSKRTSSLSQTDSPNLEKSGNENKSTLVISQHKDVSTNDTNNVMSPNVTNVLSKSVSGPEVKNRAIDRKNLSLNNYLTSTPIQQKSLQKMTMQINTSMISPAVENKTAKCEQTSEFLDGTDVEIKFKKNVITPNKKLAKAQSSSESSEEELETELMSQSKLAVKKSSNKITPALDSSDSEDEPKSKDKLSLKKSPKKVPALVSSESDESEPESKSQSIKKSPKNKTPNKKALDSNTSDSEESEEEVSKNNSKFVDDEASEASDDYESGDSQDDEDKQYEAENEIVEKGETLDSDEDLSNDSDYEKDSFIVSSEAEDNEMLSGTGDDLSTSDNELTMSAKSKKKFNERKQKQQKNASREMYEARHKDESAASSKSETVKSKKSKRQRLESSTLESDNENKQPKKNNRLRIDSSQDSIKSVDESIVIKKKKTKRLSESVCETLNEKEMTILNQNTDNDDPLTSVIKLEPKTPQKDFNMSTVVINDKIEEVQVDSNATIMGNSETLDPLQATTQADDTDDSSSDNNEIIDNYDSVLNNLNMHTKKVKALDSSLNLNKKSKDPKNPIIDQLNLTQTKKTKKNKNKNDQGTKSVKSQAEENSVVSMKQDENSSDSIDIKLLFPEDSNDSEVNASEFKPSGNKSEPAEHLIPLKKAEAKTNLLDNADVNESFNNSVLNVSKKKNKKRKSSQTTDDVPSQLDSVEPVILDDGIKIIVDTIGTHEELNLSQVITNSSKKKNKKNKSLNETGAFQVGDIDCTDGVTQIPVETSFTSAKKNKKNKNKSFDVSVNNEASFIVTESNSAKKSRKKSASTSDFIETTENPDITITSEMPVNTSTRSDKKKSKTDVSFNAEAVEPIQSQSAKKKSKQNSISVANESLAAPDMQAEPVSDKKKNKKKNKQSLQVSLTVADNAGDQSDDAPVEMSYKSEKKSDATDNVTDEALTASSEKKKHKKNKKKKNKKPDAIDGSPAEQELEGPVKRKRKGSGNAHDDDLACTPAESLQSSNEKKKRKVYLDDEYVAAYDDNAEENSAKKSKKNKSKKQKHVDEDEHSQNNAKKRKNRDDDDESEEKITKVSKQSSFDNVHVPRLPESILNQLTEKSSKISKKHNTTAAIATMPFVVEEAERRKNKPSNYLEQSVYLNDSPVKKKQKYSKHKNPKVLPFIPTALTSDSGFTSKFNINLLPKDTQFVAQASNVYNFKEAFLGEQRIKKLGTFERCKIQRRHKISKF